MIAEQLRPLARPIGELRPLPGNPRRGDVKAVARSLKRFGQRKPVVVSADGTVEAGNHMLLAALELGWTELAAVGVDDDEPTAKAFALADNRTAELGGFDMGALAAMAAEVHGVDPGLLEAASYSEADLNALLAGQRVPAKLNDPDDVPEPPAEPVTRLGDVWLLGPHRLLCGDATDVLAHDRLLDGERPAAILTDPPYGIGLDTDYTGGGRGNKMRAVLHSKDYGRSVAGDDEEFNAGPLRAMYADVGEQFWFGANYYRRSLSGSDLDGSWIVWDKRVEGNELMWGSKFELCWSARPHGNVMLRHVWAGFTATNSRMGLRREHPTEKCVALLEDILTRWCREPGIILDPYAGAGTLLIAAHRLGHQARLIELDPAYCDVICRRYAEHTGIKPVLGATGEPHDFTA